MGDFQEMPQVRAAAPFCKWATCIDRAERIPWFVSQAVRRSLRGRPGPVYLDLPADVITAEVEMPGLEALGSALEIPRPPAEAAGVERAVQAIADAERPLLILGKGAAWSDASAEARRLAERLQLPFVPSAMGKGVISDTHPLAFGGARSHALRGSDLIVLAGARFNWTFHFGRPPRFAENVDVIQIDIEPDEIGRNVPARVGLVGDVKTTFQQMLDAAQEVEVRVDRRAWIESLRERRQKNAEAIAPLVHSDAAFTNLHRMFREIRELVGDDAILVADGEHTMAVSRVMQEMHAPRQRLDAGTSGCMGVGVPYAIGAQIARPEKRVVCVNGDYAFGWNAMEIETAVRHDLPILFVVANNGTIRPGAVAFDNHAFTPGQMVRYDLMMEAVGGHGENVERADQLRPALERALASGRASLVNLAVDPDARRKAQEFAWLDRLGAMKY
jgi:thiamine pyrophosphate-dependent acetolactate synthase large subunit-like protein